MTCYCVFTLQDVLIKIFFTEEKAELFRKVYVKRGSIKKYIIDDDFMGDVKTNEISNKRNI